MDVEFNLNKLAWRSRRGTKELDTILQGFLTNHFATLSYSQQCHFSLLLEQADPNIVDWLNGYAQPENAGLQEIIALIKAQYEDSL